MRPKQSDTTGEVDGDPNRYYNYFWKHFRMLTVIGGCYGFFQTRRWSIISYTMFICMYTSVISVTLSLLYTSYLVKDHTALFATAFHVFLIGCVVVSASGTIAYERKHVNTLVDFLINSDISGYSYNTEYFRTLQASAVRKKNLLLVVFAAGYGNCALAGLSSPLIDSFLGNELILENVTDVYWRSVPLLTYWPLDAHNTSFGWITAFFMTSCFFFFAAVMITSAVILCFFFLDNVIIQLKLLIHCIDHLDQRAYRMFKLRFPHDSPKLFKNDYDDCYYECVRQNIKHHHEILSIMKKFFIVANLPIAVPFFGGAMLLGLALLCMIAVRTIRLFWTSAQEDDPRLGPKLVIFSAGVTEAINMYLLCQYGEIFQELSGDLYDALLYTKWYRRSLKCRRAIITFRCGLIKPIKLTAAKLIVLNMETFSNMVNSAYSIFNLRSATSAD